MYNIFLFIISVLGLYGYIINDFVGKKIMRLEFINVNELLNYVKIILNVCFKLVKIICFS